MIIDWSSSYWHIPSKGPLIGPVFFWSVQGNLTTVALVDDARTLIGSNAGPTVNILQIKIGAS